MRDDEPGPNEPIRNTPFFNPLTAVFIGALFLNEKISMIVIVGGVMIILGILIANKKIKA